MVGGCIKFKTRSQDWFACKVAGGCGQSGSCGVKSSKHGRTGGGAERAGGVCPFKEHSPFSEAFKIRGFIKSGMAIKSGVCPAQIVRHDKNDVGFYGKGRSHRGKEKDGMEDNVLRVQIHLY